MLFDINNLKWSDEIASAMEIDLDKMPDAVPSGLKLVILYLKRVDFQLRLRLLQELGINNVRR